MSNLTAVTRLTLTPYACVMAFTVISAGEVECDEARDSAGEGSVGVSSPEWIGEGYRLTERMRSLQWEIADWAARGVGQPSLLQAIPALASFDARSIRRMAKVAEAFPPNRRDHSLPFNVHVDLASLPASDRAELLAMAGAERWNSRAVRKAA